MKSVVLLLLFAMGCRNTVPNSDSGEDGENDTGPEIPPEQRDDDGDGFTEEQGDCDDNATTVNPSGEEGLTADDRDNDCNGIVDDIPACPGHDDGIDTLQQAIDAAPEGMTLLVCPGTYEERITISERSVGLWAEVGPERTTIQGDQSGPTITISQSEEVIINGFTILGGRSLENGGGIRADHSDVTILENILSGNEAVEWGGSIYCDSCTGRIHANTIESSRAAHGGGLAIDYGNIAVSDNLIRDNTAYASDNNVFGSNYGGGGGILIVGDSSFSGNTVESNYSASHGGGLYVVQGEGEIWNNIFRYNVTEYDGAGALTNLSRNYLHDNVFTENTAYDDAGGMRVYVGGMTIENNVFTSNISYNQGGAMKVSHAANLIIGNHFESNSTSDAGGAIELDNDNSRVENNTFVGNTANRGGALHSWDNEDEVWIVDNEFVDNVATSCGGAFQADDDHHTVTLLRNHMEGNQAPTGAAICTYNYVDLVVRNSLFYGNTASSNGGVASLNQGATTFVNIVAYGNSAPSQPGIYSYYGTMSIRNSILMSHDPGPAWVATGTTTELAYSLFYDNGQDLDTGTPDASDGNLLSDPLFADVENGDWNLLVGSPAIDAGDPEILDADGSRSDIGLHGGPDSD